ncbi:hypothetical protein AMECASPLE_022162 [Ameca splendens]|uniref:Uncharacterized protein n=1 Tax=Ameca splendens TaxID=208324 RepID=A0ABV0ZNK1_9TELE
MGSLNCCLVHKHKQQSEPLPHPLVEEGYPLIHRGEPQRTGAEMGGNSRVEECPTPLKETGSKARAVCRGEPDCFLLEPLYISHQLGLLPHQKGDIPTPKSQLLQPRIRPLRCPPSAATHNSLHLTPLAPPTGGEPIRRGIHVSSSGCAWPGSMGESPATRCLPACPSSRPGSRVGPL